MLQLVNRIVGLLCVYQTTYSLPATTQELHVNLMQDIHTSFAFYVIRTYDTNITITTLSAFTIMVIIMI